MEQDWMKRNSWSQQIPVARTVSDTTGYKVHEEDIELPVRRKQVTRNSTADITLDGTSLNQTQDESILQQQSLRSEPRKITKSFRLTTRPFALNITITETTRHDQAPVYFAVSSEWNPKQPDIVLHAGHSKDGDRLAVAHFRFSRHIRMGFGGEALNNGGGKWEEMKNMSKFLMHGRYEFEYDVPELDTTFSWELSHDVGRTRRRFAWERTRDEYDGVKGMDKYVGLRNYRLIEQDSGQVLAVMLTNTFSGITNRGQLNFHEEMPKEMEQVVILTAVCICEKAERRVRRSPNSCGGP